VVLGLGLSLLLLAVLPALSAPQTISRVSFLVDGREAGPEIASLASIAAGQDYTLRLVDDAVRQLYASELFSGIRVELSGAAEVSLTFLLTRKLTVRYIYFRAPAGVSTSALSARLSVLKSGTEFTPERLARAEGEVQDLLRQDGYFDARVTCRESRDAEASVVDLTFEIVPGERYTIDRIILNGNGPIPLPEIRAKMKSRPGQPYIPSLLEEDRTVVVDLYKARGYQQAQVDLTEARFHPETRTVTLELRLDPGRKVEIVVRGAKVPLRLLTPIWQERVFEQWGLEEGEARILSYLRQKGYLFAVASSSVEQRDHVLRVVYDVEPGAHYRIRSLVFEGMTYFTVSQLKSLLGLGEGLFASGIVGGQRVFELPRQVEDLYRSQGFADVRVGLDFYRRGRSVTAIFSVKEGPQQKVRDVSIVGATQYPEDVLLAKIQSRPGGSFYGPRVQRDAETLKAFYLDQGFRGTTVAAAVRPAGDDLHSIVFSIEEGRRVSVSKIIITGLRVTRRSTVLREMAIREGEVARESAVLDSERNLQRLGIFSDVQLDEVPVAPGLINIVLRLQEGQRNYVGLGVGLETQYRAGDSSLWNNNISPRVTAEYIRSNLFGNASQFSLAGQFSLREKRAVVALEERYLLGLAVQNSFNALLERVELPSFTFDRQGLSFNLVKPLFRDVVLMTTLQYARTTLVSLSVAPNAVDREFYPYSKTSIAAILSRDRRDDPFNPVRGSFTSLAVEWAYPLFGSEADFQKIFFKYLKYVPLSPRVNFDALFRLGLGRGLIPIHERFFAGGSNSFRGEHFDELGPRDSLSGQPVGGKLLVLLNLELTVPFLVSMEDLSWVFFYDVGNVFATRSDFSFRDLENAVGFGLRYRTPFGPLRLEIGLNLNAPGAGRKVIPFITIGNMF
jgi:outer membrane protein insertion porin family